MRGLVLIAVLVLLAGVGCASAQAPVLPAGNVSCETRLLTTERALIETKAAVLQIQLRLLQAEYDAKTAELAKGGAK